MGAALIQTTTVTDPQQAMGYSTLPLGSCPEPTARHMMSSLKGNLLSGTLVYHMDLSLSGLGSLPLGLLQLTSGVWISLISRRHGLIQ